jgi:FAD/FMN-containing dehydrogenase
MATPARASALSVADMISRTETALGELRSRLAGAVYEPGAPEYAEACTLFNAMIERRPALVARCAAPEHVVVALAFAREHGLEIAVRAGGHSVAGLSLVDDGLVIDVRGMSGIAVDPKRRVARVGAGVTWADLDRATQPHGLATTGGRVSSTGVAGLTLGGGSGWLERKHGLACDNLLAVELVTADGELVRASEDEHPELFWALRGGGGNFGVVTSFEFRLHPLESEVFAGLALYPAEHGRELLALYRDVMLTAPEELSLAYVYLTAPAEPDIPEHLHGRLVVGIAGMYAGPVDDGQEALRDVREFGPPEVDFFGPMPYPDFQCMIDDPPGYRNYWTAEHLRDLPDEAIEAIASRSEELPPGPAQLFIVAWGGAVARASEEASPLAGRDARFVVHPFALWEDPSDDERLIAWARAFRTDLREFATGAAYLNFIGDEGRARVRAGYRKRSYERLAQVKADWDPENVFRASGNVAPSTS